MGFYNRQPVPQLIQLIGAYTAGSRDSDWKATCASEELARRGEEVVSALIRLMETHRDPVIDLLAMEALCGKGHSGSSAIDYLLKRLPGDKTGFTIEAHEALACMGPHAKRAIPYLIQTSGDDFRAVQTLGELAKYHPTLIVPRLTQLLDNPARIGDAADALEHAGAPARPALDALSSHLSIAATEHRNDIASALTKAIGSVGDPRITVPLLLPLLDQPGTREAAAAALGRIGPPAAAAVPRLIGRLDDPEIGWTERSTDIRALASIDMASLQVLGVLLHEAASDKNGIGNLAASPRQSGYLRILLPN
jgi:HEAT repeat protein